jgi:hypothetical protein
MSREPNKFKPGDIVRVVRGSSKDWILRDPVRVVGYRRGHYAVIDIESLDGGNAVINGCSPFCFDFDCELDVFLSAAQEAVRDA